MILSRNEIEELAAAVMKDFNQFFYRNNYNNHNLRVPQPQPTPIDQFATNYLNLKVSFAVFEDTRGHIEAKCSKCGRTTAYDVISMRRVNHILRISR